MHELPKVYEPHNYEDEIYKKWEESGLFNPDVCVKKKFTEDDAPTFSIVLPPPNVTGTLHMGHAAMLAIEDVMVRYHRMKGDRTLWVPGTDHAAIATQSKVEKLVMEKEGKSKYDLGRSEFLKRVEKFAQESHDTIVNQCKKMGASLDWSREAYTLDEKRNLAVRTVFKKMYDDGLIYRGYRVINWSVKGQSTCSDDELVHVERPAKLYYFKYSKDFPITIATTRPETKLGDTAVAVNPKDKKYKKYIGKEFIVDLGTEAPLKIKIISDDSVDKDFGTGALGVTSAHSAIDFEMYQKQKALGNDIGLIQVIGEDGKMTDATGKDYAGLTVLEARAKFVEYLRSNNLLEKEEDITQNVGTSDRFGDVVEPLPKLQWFIDVNKTIKERDGKTLKELMQDVVKSKKIEIIPDRFEKTYFDWIDNLRDWCISRQIWFGHRIPVWYKGEEIHVGIEAPTGEGWEQDSDTLDTWFSAGLWTFSTLGYPDLNAEDLKKYHPTSVLETGYDILFFWVARMILMTTYTLGEVPFKTVYLHGLVRDEQGRKMSKSLDNIINPLDMIAKYGTDATRLSLLLGNTPGNDMKLSEEKIAGFRNFTNKLWNISRFILSQVDNKEPVMTMADSWIVGRMAKSFGEFRESMEKNQFSVAGESLRDFTWNDLADWYLEISKIEGNKSGVLMLILDFILKAWHPFMPFVTEAIWQEIHEGGKMLMVENFKISEGLLEASPKKTSVKNEETAWLDFEVVRNAVVTIRSLRAEYKIEPVKKITVKINFGKQESIIRENEHIIKGLARLEKIEFIESGAEISLDLTGVIDVEKEKPRLEKEIAEIKKYVSGLENKLSNQEFVSNAPPAVVEKEKAKLSEAQGKLEKLTQQLENLK